MKVILDKMSNKLTNLQCKEYNIKESIKEEKRVLHKKLVNDNKLTFRLLDIAVILIIIINLSAIFITNLMVSQKEYEYAEENNLTIEYKEMNPVVATSQNIEHDGTLLFVFIFKMLKHLILLLGPILIYIYYRRTIYTEFGLLCLIIFIVYVLFLVSTDFVHDLSLLISKIINS